MNLLERNQELLNILALALGVELRALEAVLKVEARGEGIENGRPIIRLEVHHLWELVPREKRAAVDARFHVDGPRPQDGHKWLNASPGGIWVPLHQPHGQAMEWCAFACACEIDQRAAVEATSFGCGQVLGAEWQAQGYPDPQAFVRAQYDEAAQLRTMVLYIEQHGLKDELARKDWLGFARVYNGRNQAAWYAGRLAEAYAA